MLRPKRDCVFWILQTW